MFSAVPACPWRVFAKAEPATGKWRIARAVLDHSDHPIPKKNRRYGFSTNASSGGSSKRHSDSDEEEGEEVDDPSGEDGGRERHDRPLHSVEEQPHQQPSSAPPSVKPSNSHGYVTRRSLIGEERAFAVGDIINAVDAAAARRKIRARCAKSGHHLRSPSPCSDDDEERDPVRLLCPHHRWFDRSACNVEVEASPWTVGETWRIDKADFFHIDHDLDQPTPDLEPPAQAASSSASRALTLPNRANSMPIKRPRTDDLGSVMPKCKERRVADEDNTPGPERATSPSGSNPAVIDPRLATPPPSTVRRSASLRADALELAGLVELFSRVGSAKALVPLAPNLHEGGMTVNLLIDAAQADADLWEGFLNDFDIRVPGHRVRLRLILSMLRAEQRRAADSEVDMP